MSVTGFDDTIRWYDEYAEQYAAAALPADLNHINTFSKLLPKAARVLDAGCGPGRDTALLQSHGFTTVGLDISRGLLNVAQRRFPDINFIEGNLLNLPFEDNSFDGAWANASLLHLETVDDVKQALREMHRVLTLGGVLHIVVKAQTGADKTAIVSDKLSGHDRFFQYFTVGELKRLLAESHFEPIQLKEYSETDTIPTGRPEVRVIWSLARKIHSS